MPATEKNNKDAIRSIKKILVSKGKAAGNFYAIVDSKSKGGIAVTMSAKDPKGAKVLTLGKSMKSEVKNGKFARGTVIFDKDTKKLLMEIAAGNLSASNLKKAVKTGFGSDDLKKLIQKAKITTPGSEPATSEVEEASEDTTGEAMTTQELADIELSADEISELENEQVALSDLNDSLGIFLSQEDDEQALEALISSSINEIRRLNDAEATQEAKRDALAVISSVIEFETQESPNSISSGMRILLEEVTKLTEILPDTIVQNEAFMKQIEDTKNDFLAALKQVGEKHFKAEIKKYNAFPKATADNLDLALANAQNPVYVSIRDALYARLIPTSASMSDGTWSQSFMLSVDGPNSIKMIEAYHPVLMQELNKKWGELPFDFKTKHIDECGSSWESVKAKYIKTPIIMERFTAYRKSTVDDLLRTLRSKHKVGGKEVLLAKSVGSQNLTSDYDLTLASSDGSGIEIEAIKEFNSTIKGWYGKQPGTVFDTNLYAKDFLRVKDTILAEGTEDADLDAITTFTSLEREDQDIAALTKMCQYMGKTQWDSYIQSVLSELPDANKKQAVEAQMREAANLLTVKRLEILKSFSNVKNVETTDDSAMWEDLIQRLKAKLVDASEELREQIETSLDNCGYLLNYLETQNEIQTQIKANPVQIRLDQLLSSKASKSDIAEARKNIKSDKLLMNLQSRLGQTKRFYSNLMEDVLAEVEHFFDDEILEARNDIYMDKMQAIRNIQNKHRALDSLKGKAFDKVAIKALLTLGDQANFDACPTDADKQEWVTLKSDSLKEQAKRLLGEANFYAAEAYLSEGPLQHIVFGNQSGNTEAMEKLKPEHFLESVNEQTGDFMKDIGHHGNNSGEAFIQTAKYLSRMFEGIIKLHGKMSGVSDVNFTNIPTNVGWGDAVTMKAKIETDLMPIRAAQGQYATMDDEEKYQVGEDIGYTIYGTRDVPTLVSKVLSMSAKLNAMVRQEIEMRSNHDGLKYQEPNQKKKTAPSV